MKGFHMSLQRPGAGKITLVFAAIPLTFKANRSEAAGIRDKGSKDEAR